MTHTFILTDMMKTGYNPDLHTFLSYHTLPNQEIDIDEQFYKLHFYNLKKYTRRLACLFPRPRLYENSDYCEDLAKRIKKLSSLDFKFIISEPWESQSTIRERLNTLHIDHLDYAFWSGSSSWFWFIMYNRYKNKDLKFDHSKKIFDFFYLNKNSRIHRVKLFNRIMSNQLLDNSLFSFIEKGFRLDRQYELPWASNPYPYRGLDQDIYELPYNHSAYNIVSETHTHDEIFMTEKIWKPIIAQQIFVVHGKQNYLKDLRELGFQTFGNIFDESYDEEADGDKRIEKIVELCKWLKKQDHQKLYKQTESIRKHNLEHFFDRTALESTINKTVLDLFELSDSSKISS